MKKLASICKEIGCSGMDNKCPGNPDCSIIKKILGHTPSIPTRGAKHE